MTGATPTSLPALAALWIGMLAFVVALLLARRGAEREARGNPTRSRRSMAGIAIQAVAIALCGAGFARVTADPLADRSLVEAALVAVLMAASVALFAWASRTMGRNWSIVARTRADHRLVTEGPFALMRHPIYTALFLLMLAVAIGTGHLARLWLAVPLYMLGTWLRISVEERLLRDLFPADHDAWAGQVKRFVPGVF